MCKGLSDGRPAPEADGRPVVVEVVEPSLTTLTTRPDDDEVKPMA